MGQQPAPFATWRSQNKPTSRDSAKPMGQQTRQSNVSHPAMEPDHVTKSKSRFETDRKIPSENERKPSDFAPYGMAVNYFLSTGGQPTFGDGATPFPQYPSRYFREINEDGLNYRVD